MTIYGILVAMKNTKKVLEYCIITGLFLVPFIPFIVPSAYFFPFITGKGFAFRILVEILFGLYFVLALVEKEYRPKISWITKSVLFFTIIVFIADIFGENPYKSIWSNYERMEGFVLIAHLALFYIVLSSFFNSSKRWIYYFNTTIGASVLMSIYALFQFFGKININQGSVRVDATFGNATYFAIYLVFHIFLSIYMISSESLKKWQKWIYILVAGMESIILYFTATRGAVLGLIGGLFLTGLIILFFERNNKAVRKLSYAMLGVVLVIIASFFLIKNTQYAKTNPILSRFANLSLSELKTQGRYFVWPMAIEGFKERPILGWGQEGFNYVFNKNYNPKMWNQEQWFDRTHNVFLDWLIAGGLFGFLSYILLYFALFYALWYKSSSLNVLEKSIITGMISAYIFHNIFVFDNLISYIMFFVVLSYIHFNSSHNIQTKSNFYSKTFNHDSISYITIPISLVMIIGVIYFVNVPALLANTTLIQALSSNKGGHLGNLELFKKAYSYNSFGDSEILEQLIPATIRVIGEKDLDPTLKQSFFDLTRQKLEQKISETPNDTRYLVYVGSFYNAIGQYDEAIKYLNRALENSPKKQSVLFELGNSYIGKGDNSKMMEVFRKAYELEPTSDTSIVTYAVGAIYTKDTKILTELSSKINKDAIINDDRILSAYSRIGDVNSVLTILNERIKRDPNNIKNKLTLASVYADIGRKSDAINIIKEVILKDPSLKEKGEQYIKEIESK